MQDFKNKIVYQIWPRSFKDSNGDGIGDLPGIMEKLDYLKHLGVDLLWLSPIYATGNRDYGYDVDDYFTINPEFGTMADFDALLQGAKARNMGILMDLVANHTSDRHEWFQEALKTADSPHRDHYIFRKGKTLPDGRRMPPNNWLSAFGGSAWQYHAPSDSYYLTMFTPHQPDLNWDNPSVREGIHAVMRFWLDKGVAGFRMDVINTISKRPGLPDAGRGHKLDFPFQHIVSQPRSHDYLKEMHREVLARYPDAITVGEGMVTDLENLVRYTNPHSQELHMMFQFDLHLLGCGPLGRFDFRRLYRWTPRDFKKVVHTWQLGVQEGGGWLGNFLSNHDNPRAVSRFGEDGPYRRKSAKALALLNFTLRGTPFLYQGEEIGMTDFPLTRAHWRDFESKNAYEVLQSMMHLPEKVAEKVVNRMSRDHARTPMQWTPGPHGGFTTGTPWMPVNPNHASINVASEKARENSLLNFYRTLAFLRKDLEELSYGAYQPVAQDHPTVLGYLRGTAPQPRSLVLINLSRRKVRLAMKDLPECPCHFLLGNYGTRTLSENMELHPYEALLFRLENIPEKV